MGTREQDEGPSLDDRRRGIEGQLIALVHPHALESDLLALSSPELGGRYPGTPGEARAARWIEERLAGAGVEPALGAGYRAPFRVKVPVWTGRPRLAIKRHKDGWRSFEHLVDFTVTMQGASRGGRVTAGAIWIGDGRDLTGLDLRGRVAVGRIECPESELLTAILRRIEEVRDRGAVAWLAVSGETRMRKVMCDRRSEPGIPCGLISPEVAGHIFPGGPQVKPGTGSDGAVVSLHWRVAMEEVESAGNVLARLGPDRPFGLVLCAHYDHLGQTPGGDRHFPGAADNATGVAATLEAAKALEPALESMPFATLVAFTTAEEQGSLGAARLIEELGDRIEGDATVLVVDELAGTGETPLFLLAPPGWRNETARPTDERELGVATLLVRQAFRGYADNRAFEAARLGQTLCLLSYVPDDDRHHTVEDTPERIDPARLHMSCRALVAFGLRLALLRARDMR